MDQHMRLLADACEEVWALPSVLSWTVMGRVAAQAVGNDSFAWLDRPDCSTTYRVLQSGFEPVPALLASAITKTMAIHPQMTAYRTAPTDLSPRRLSDVISMKDWANHPVHHALGQRTGNRYQISVMTASGIDRGVIGWIFNRTSRDFTDGEIERARRWQFGLVALERQVRLRGRAGDRCEVATGLGITPREHQVLLLLAQGEPASAIGTALGLSERTVHKHLQNAYRKLDCHDRLGAYRRSVELGLVSC